MRLVVGLAAANGDSGRNQASVRGGRVLDYRTNCIQRLRIPVAVAHVRLAHKTHRPSNQPYNADSIQRRIACRLRVNDFGDLVSSLAAVFVALARAVFDQCHYLACW